MGEALAINHRSSVARGQLAVAAHLVDSGFRLIGAVDDRRSLEPSKGPAIVMDHRHRPAVTQARLQPTSTIVKGDPVALHAALPSQPAALSPTDLNARFTGSVPLSQIHVIRLSPFFDQSDMGPAVAKAASMGLSSGLLAGRPEKNPPQSPFPTRKPP